MDDKVDRTTLLPPVPRLSDYPVSLGIILGCTAVCLLIFITGRFDPTKGVLTVSFLVVIGFMSALIFAIRFTIPQDPETAAIVGGLVAAFGAVVAYWIGGGHGR